MRLNKMKTTVLISPEYLALSANTQINETLWQPSKDPPEHYKTRRKYLPAVVRVNFVFGCCCLRIENASLPEATATILIYPQPIVEAQG